MTGEHRYNKREFVKERPTIKIQQTGNLIDSKHSRIQDVERAFRATLREDTPTNPMQRYTLGRDHGVRGVRSNVVERF